MEIYFFRSLIFLKLAALSCDRAANFITQLCRKLAGEGIADRAHGVVDFIAERGHHSNHNDGDERENDRVLNKPLSFFLGSE